MNKTFSIVLTVLGAVVGAAVAWMNRPAAEPQEIIETVYVDAPRSADAEVSRDEAVPMKEKIARATSVEHAEEETERPAENTTEKNKGAGKFNRGQGRYDRMMKLKAENPKHFTFTTNEAVRSARFNQYQCQARSAYYLKADEDKMAEEEKAVHLELLACERDSIELEEVNKIWDRPAELENLRWDEQRKIDEERVPLFNAEAKMLIRQELVRMGFSEDDAHIIAEDAAGVITHSRDLSTYNGKMD